MSDAPLKHSADFIVIGAGMAGASVAAELAREADVLLLEMESQPGYHTTGRSAAIFAPTYGPAPMRAFTRASEDFYRNPPQGFVDQPLLSPRDTLMIARPDQMDFLHNAIAELSGEATVELLENEALFARQPLVRKDYAQAGYLDRGGSDIDVGALHQAYLKAFRDLGGSLFTMAEVRALKYRAGRWHLSTAAGDFEAPKVINAAGAWADQIGALACAETIGLVPKRRTALIVAAPAGVATDTLPLTADIEEAFYLKPEAGRLLVSPADESPSAPCDAQPEELDVAICVDLIETAFNLSVRRIENKWAGLRSFVADKGPVVGFSAQADGFFWLAGQGGYGIQTAPALSRYAAALALGQPAPQDILDHGLDPASVHVDRLKA